MRSFKNAWFKRFARREKISDKTLRKAIRQANDGLIDADLGGNVIKQRIPRRGQGKSGGYRTIVIFKKDDKAFFIYGFAKSDQANISKQELQAFKLAAKELLALSEKQIEQLIKNNALMEIA
ncbi:MAG: type II toxin-antitoxin system RelE/ParE family toxin [Candidatus Promineifilaceae bacterium]